MPGRGINNKMNKFSLKSINLATSVQARYLQEVIEVIANAIFVVANVSLIRAVTETCPSRLVDIKKVRYLHIYHL